MPVDPDLLPFEPAGRRFVAFRPLVRAVGLAADARQLVLALAGLVLLSAGWQGVDRAFGRDARERGWFDPGATIRVLDSRPTPRWPDAPWLVTEPARVVVEPFAALFLRGVRPATWSWALARGAWALVVWGLVGGAIARIAALRVTAGQGVGVGSAARFAARRALTLIVAPLTPFLVVGLLAAGCAAFGLLYRIPGVGPTVAGLLGFVPLLAGLLMALILVGLALGWPLMVATVAVEGEDIADALSRSYSYVNQRGVRYLAHLLVAWGLGIVGLVVAVGFGRLVLALADWGVALGAPAEVTIAPSPVAGSLPLAILLRDFWTEAVGWVPHAYMYSYFWSVVPLIYLVMRRDVDGTDPHDIYLPEQAADTFAGATPPPVVPEVAPPAEAAAPIEPSA